MFIENKAKDSKPMYSKGEDSIEEEFKETAPRRSRRKQGCIVREEQVTKDIMLGSQRTLQQMLGTRQKSPKFVVNNPSSKGWKLENL